MSSDNSQKLYKKCGNDAKISETVPDTFLTPFCFLASGSFIFVPKCQGVQIRRQCFRLSQRYQTSFP